MTLREIIYFISDELKLTSDDSIFNEEHIRFLINKYRASLLNQYYNNKNNNISPYSNYQTINISLEEYEDSKPFGCDKVYYKSIESIPNIMNISDTKVYPTGSYCNYKISLVSKDRMKFIGFNKWMKNIIYCTINDKYLYLHSLNDISDLKDIQIQGIFEDVEKAFKLSNNEECDILDMEYPLEESLVSLLIQSVVQEMSPKTITPEDTYNNASDDKASLANYIARNQKQRPV